MTTASRIFASLAAFALILVGATAVAPEKARADETTDALLIGGAVTAAVVVTLVVLSNDDDEDDMPPQSP